MKFTDALKLSQAATPPDARPFVIGLACGFTANHLQIFLAAHLRRLATDRRISVQAGVYGDCLGNLERLTQTVTDGAVVVLEWSDLDPRLGIRQAGGWSPRLLPDILQTVEARAEQFQHSLARAATVAPVALCLPTLPLPPVAFTPGWLASEFELQLHARLTVLAAELARQPAVRIVNAQRLDQLSPPAARLDVRNEFLSGFPYHTAHVSAVAELLAHLLLPPAPKKGLITDLDDTLWRGLLGEVGASGVSWDLDNRSQAHALYQQLLQSLADSGVLLAVASKNDQALVEEALRRGDLLLRHESFFPVQAHWGPKSESVHRILRAWNISADSVVFIDDSPLELAEVQAAHPDITTIPFPRGQDQAIYGLLGRLRDLFGKPAVREEDQLRLDSLRRSAELPGTGETRAEQDAFLKGIEAELLLEMNDEAPRALELVNKTNQFNLNGRRYSDGEWRAYLGRPGGFLCTVSYRDKFGPLGKIAVLGGRRDEEGLVVDTWVLSCRAFSRRIEHRCVEFLFDHFGVEEIAFAFKATPKNGPMQEFFAGLLGTPPLDEFRLTREQFVAGCPPLFLAIKEPVHG